MPAWSVTTTQRKLEITPAWLPLEAWEAYLEHRRKLRKPLTTYGEKLAIGRLADLREHGHDPLKVLNEAILMGWQGLWCNERTREDIKGGDANCPVTTTGAFSVSRGTHPAENTPPKGMSQEAWEWGLAKYRLHEEFRRKQQTGEIPKGMDIDEWKKRAAK